MRFTVGAAVLLASVGLALGPGATGVAGATGTSSTSTSSTTAPAGQAQINSAEAQVATVESQIAQEQSALDQADEQYNQAAVDLNATQSALQATAASITTARSRLAGQKAELAKDAVANYVGNTSSQAVASLFAAANSQAQTRQLYEQIGVANVAAVVAQVQRTTRQLTTTRSKLLAERKVETGQLASETQARATASAAANQSEATLAQVKGTLAAEIAQQAAAQAAAAAAAAAAAKTPAAAQAAATQASQASQVASTVGGGSAAAASAATSANQATTSSATVSGTPVTTIASGNDPLAAGLAAVHGAMKYLGVPYVWGGAGPSGFDCSGLTMVAWAQAGVQLVHSAADQYSDVTHVSLTDLEPGDLLFYDLDGTGIDHVVMYVGPYLDGQPTPYGVDTIIQAAHTGTVVSFDPFWSSGLVGAGRP
jgi:cell wall-associated NlpC family hydrolase